MITGFNTDVEHDGVVYHVQTEDKGLDSPLILSLVYSGGAILASKRSRYEDLIASGFNEEVLADRLKRQHRLICAAINAGRIEDLKRMGERVEEQEAQPDSRSNQAPETSKPLVAEIPAPIPVNLPPVATLPNDVAAPATPRPSSADSAYTVYDSRRKSSLGEVAESERGLVLTILDEEEFRAGESFDIQILVVNRFQDSEKPVAGVALSVKILGTTFRPQIYSVKTGRDGVAVASVQIPQFTSGRAAILIRVAGEGRPTEMRRVIHPAG